MKKSDLRTGMVVTLRNGNEYIVFLNTRHQYQNNYNNVTCGFKDVLVDNNHNWYDLADFDEDLKSQSIFDNAHESDIMKIEIPTHPYAFVDLKYEKSKRKLIWERIEGKEMTVTDIEKLLGYKIKIVAEKK